MVEKAGPCPALPRRPDRARSPSLDISDEVSDGGEQGLLSIAFAPDFEARRLSTPTSPTGARTSAWSSYRVGRRTARSSPAARARSCGWRTSPPTTTAACSCSAPTSCSTSAPATAASPTTPSATARTSARCWARSCGSTRVPRASGPTRSPPTTRSPSARARGPRSSPTACATPGASASTANRTRCHRRRRPELARGDRLRAASEARGRQLRLVGLRGDRALQPGPGGARARPADPHLRPRRGLLGHRRLRRPRSGACPRSCGRYLYGDFCAGELRSLVPSEGGAQDDRALGLEVPGLSSFGEDAAGQDLRNFARGARVSSGAVRPPATADLHARDRWPDRARSPAAGRAWPPASRRRRRRRRPATAAAASR